MLALKCFIKCPNCGKALMGSASKGRTSYYHYYHCNATCGYRIKAEEGNSLFEDHLQDFALNERAVGLFKQVVMDVHTNECKATGDSKKQYIEE